MVGFEIVERLLGKGYDVRLYDRNVNLAALVGANRDYILNLIPHISRFMVNSLNEVLAHAETLVIGNGDPEFKTILKSLRPGQVIVDLMRVTDNRSEEGRYEGICW